MPERPFICTPSGWIYEPALNQVSERAEIVFRRLAQVTDSNWRFSADPLVIRGECFALRPSIRVADISRCLDELAALGAISYAASGGRRWIQIAEHLRYRQDGHKAPRWGDAEASQAELPMPVPVSTPKPRRAKVKPLPVESAIDAGQVAYESEEDATMARLANLVGLRESVENGGMWRMRYRKNRVALLEAMGDLQLRLRDKETLANPAAWLTDKFERICREVAA